MPAVAIREPYTLVIREDDDVQNPREEMDNFGTMVCFHNRYNLGDKHEYATPHDFLRGLAGDTVSAKDICDFAIAEKAQDVELKYDLDSGAWDVLSFYNDEWHITETFEGGIEGQYELIADTLLDEMGVTSLLRLAELENVILPLYLYDHSGLAMSTVSFGGRAQHAEWDSGQVGWIHHKKTFGRELDITETLEAEVEYYDSYLRGECYGFQLYENGVEVDSCWGFLGSFRELKDDIESHLPKECAGMVESLNDGYSDSELDDLLYEQEQTAFTQTEGDFDMSNTENATPSGFEVRVNPVKEPKGKVLAMASIKLETPLGDFAVNNIRIMNGEKGPFVAMPAAKNRDGEYKDISHPTTKEGRMTMNTAIMDAYNDVLLKGDREQEKPSMDAKLNEAKKEAAKAPKAKKSEKAAPNKGDDGR